MRVTTFVDYSGQTLDIINRRTGEIRAAQILVRVLGTSCYTFAEATWTKTLPDWLGTSQRGEVVSNARKQYRCAIYTRKSSEEGLNQDFNSLQAQREACEAYIASQKHEGWKPVPSPGLKRLLLAIQVSTNRLSIGRSGIRCRPSLRLQRRDQVPSNGRPTSVR